MNRFLLVATMQLCNCQIVSNSADWVDKVSAIATAVIALFDIVLTILVFYLTRKDNKAVEEQHKRFELMHSLILEHNISRLYDFYDKVSDVCAKLLQSDEQSVKDEVNTVVKNEAKKFRLRFMTLFVVIDPALYKSLLETTDKLVDGITNAIYNPGIKLNYEPKFDEEISQKISKNRTEVLTILFHIGDSNTE